MYPIDAILAGDVGMNAIFLASIFTVAVIITTISFVFIYWSTKHPEEGDSHALAKYEKYWVVIIVIVFAAFSIVTISYLPYPYAHSGVKPNMIVDVTGQQFSWTLCEAPYWNSTQNGASCSVTNFPITAGDTVEFNLTSRDVNHDFGVYKCSNTACTTASLLAQVQVMPGFYNSILITFSTPGIYYIRCLEFCGFGHYTMISSLNVTSA